MNSLYKGVIGFGILIPVVWVEFLSWVHEGQTIEVQLAEQVEQNLYQNYNGFVDSREPLQSNSIVKLSPNDQRDLIGYNTSRERSETIVEGSGTPKDELMISDVDSVGYQLVPKLVVSGRKYNSDDGYDIQGDFRIRNSAKDALEFVDLDSFDARVFATFWSHKIFQLHAMILNSQASFIHEVYLYGHSKFRASEISEKLLSSSYSGYLQNFSMLCGKVKCFAAWDVKAGPLVDGMTKSGYQLNLCDVFFTDSENCIQSHLVDYSVSSAEYGLYSSVCYEGLLRAIDIIGSSYQDCMKYFFKPRIMLEIEFTDSLVMDAKLSLQSTEDQRDMADYVDNESYLKELEPHVLEFNSRFKRAAKISKVNCEKHCEVEIVDAMPTYPELPYFRLESLIFDSNHPLPFIYTWCEPIGEYSGTEKLAWQTLTILCKHLPNGILHSYDPNKYTGVNTY